MNNRISNQERQWSAGLDFNTVNEIQLLLGIKHNIQDAGENFAVLESCEQGRGTIWLGLELWKNLPEHKRTLLDNMSKIMILSENATLEDLDALSGSFFAAVVRRPLQGQMLRDAVLQAAENSNIYKDIHRMSREVFLERELLSRKNANLYFLLDFLSSTSGLLRPEELLLTARSHLADLLPINDVAAFFWSTANEEKQAYTYLQPVMLIPAPENSSACAKWQNLLLEAAQSIHPLACNDYEICSLPAHCINYEVDLDNDLNLFLPLRIKNKSVGIVLINLKEQHSLGKDNLEVLESAMSHLALGLRSSHLYSQAKHRADRDGLTGTFNRLYFDEIFKREFSRHKRYSTDLSLLMLDVDHFKQINDTYGHLIGDEVLRELTQLLGEDLRYADCLARYGGEEFVLMLPHTNREQAWVLAERLRRKVAAFNFCSGRLQKQVSISIGLVVCAAHPGLEAEEMVKQADIALYQAKNRGRNCTVEAQGKLIPAQPAMFLQSVSA